MSVVQLSSLVNRNSLRLLGDHVHKASYQSMMRGSESKQFWGWENLSLQDDLQSSCEAGSMWEAKGKLTESGARPIKKRLHLILYPAPPVKNRIKMYFFFYHTLTVCIYFTDMNRHIKTCKRQFSLLNFFSGHYNYSFQFMIIWVMKITLPYRRTRC